MKTKSLKDLPASLEPYFAWVTKIDTIKLQIANIESLRKYEVIGISVFLLKSQLIEFELKQLISELDLQISLYTGKNIFSRRIRSPSEFSKSLFGLTLLIRLLEEFESEHLTKLKQLLNKLISPRNDLTHNLFDSNTSLSDIKSRAVDNIALANDILGEIDRIRKVIRKR